MMQEYLVTGDRYRIEKAAHGHGQFYRTSDVDAALAEKDKIIADQAKEIERLKAEILTMEPIVFRG